MSEAVRVGVIGDFDPSFHSHRNTNAALERAAARLPLELTIDWLPTPSVTEQQLQSYDALWLSPGSPYRSIDGALAAVEFARCRDWPFTAT